MAHAHTGERPNVRVVTITISDTRTSDDDKSGNVLRECLVTAGFIVVRHAIVPDDPDAVRTAIVRVFAAGEADAVVSNGGTGIAPRDNTYEVVRALVDKELMGFGEAFRRLSWEEVGPRAILSRAIAGTYRNGIVAALPGSTNAVKLGVEKLVAPILAHAVALVQG